ncbi:MAG TPA: nitroreductase family protein [Burkholderiales bacterium]|nr:nitroreductase family protein [Burkholderiales bacterium]
MSTLTKVALSFIGQLKPDRAKARAIEPLIALPHPDRHGGLPLMQALARRRSGREFSSGPLSDTVISSLLWAAFGINRPQGNGRTAPSARDAQEIDIYAAMAGGLYIYDPFAHSLALVAPVDARKVTGYQDFVDDAPLDLVYVADHAHMDTANSEQSRSYSAVATGAIVQNVYLYCASAGLATVVRGWLDRKALGAALRLSEHESIVAAQTVGYPRT